MSAKFNTFCELEIVGTVTKDPEAKFTPEGKKANFSPISAWFTTTLLASPTPIPRALLPCGFT
ncbi:MAG: hypothetical protein NTW32_20890 [Chloroflexi bacterium]|nr:hypothetical protein [Chloroflexota bacterium]